MSSLFHTTRPRLFSTELEPSCGYCEYGTPTRDGGAILCARCGVVAPDYSCKRFRYDPISRRIRAKAIPQGYSEEDFSL